MVSVCCSVSPPWPPWRFKWTLDDGEVEDGASIQRVLIANFTSEGDYLSCSKSPEFNYGYIYAKNLLNNEKLCYNYTRTMVCRRGQELKDDEYWLQTALKDSENVVMAECILVAISHGDVKHRRRKRSKTAKAAKETTSEPLKTPLPKRKEKHDEGLDSNYRDNFHANDFNGMVYWSIGWKEGKGRWRFIAILMMLFLIHITLIFMIGVLVGLYLSRRRRAPPRADGDARSSRSWFSLASRLSSTSLSLLRGKKKTVAYTAVEEERPYRTVEKWTQSVDAECTFVKNKRTPNSQVVKEAATQDESAHAGVPIEGEHRTQVATPMKRQISNTRAVAGTQEEENPVGASSPPAVAHTQTASRIKSCYVSSSKTFLDCQIHAEPPHVHGSTV